MAIGDPITPDTYVNKRENILHSFASYNCLFTLSGVRMDAIRNKSFLKLPVENVIARSSGIGGTQESFTKRGKGIRHVS